MSSRDETPNFDWVKSQQPAAKTQGKGTGQVSISPGDSERRLSKAEESAIDNGDDSILDPLPDPENNVSDGTTLILKESGKVKDDEDSSVREMSTNDQTLILGQERESFEQSETPLLSSGTPSSVRERSATPGSKKPQAAKVAKRTDTAAAISDVGRQSIDELAGRSDESSSRLLWLVLASYASLMTLLALFLAMRSGQSHQLESLPDIEPEPVQELSYVAPGESLAPGHRLQLGQQQRFGNLLVEAVKVVREPLEFQHYSGDSSKQRPASSPVYKLYLKFTNVSEDQEIAPFDRQLTLRRVRSANDQDYSNYYLFTDVDGMVSDPVSLYPLSSSSDWDMSGQQLGKTLKPGESLITYLASNESGAESLSGEVIWRFQFRKGFSPSGHGVTTLADVVFRIDDV